MNYLLMILISFALAACGGGSGSSSVSGGSGSGSGDTPVPGGQSRGLSFNPTQLSADIYAGEQRAVYLTAKAERDFPGVVNVAIVDKIGVITTDVKISQISSHEFGATIYTNPMLLPGVYTGSLTVKLCQDEATVCAKPHAFSPWILPYRFEVKAFAGASGLTPLAAWPGVANWNVYQGNTSHTGHVPVTIDVAKISPRFSIKVEGSVSGLTFEDGLGFASDKHSVIGINEQNGTGIWTKTVSDGYMGPPSVNAGKVFAVVGDFSASTLMQLDAKTGVQLKSGHASNPNFAFAPTVDNFGGYVKENGGGDLLAFDPTTLNFTYAVNGMSAVQWGLAYVPLLGKDFGYFYNCGSLHKFDRKSGHEISHIFGTIPLYQDAYSNNVGSPVLLAPDRLLLIETNYKQAAPTYAVTAFDLTGNAVAWTKPVRDAAWNPVFASGTIYIVNGDQIQALRPSDGALLWSWTIPTEELVLTGYQIAPEAKNLIITNNVLFAGFKNHVYAIDLTSHQAVWTFPRGGGLSMSSNGVLYISGSGLIFALNVK